MSLVLFGWARSTHISGLPRMKHSCPIGVPVVDIMPD